MVKALSQQPIAPEKALEFKQYRLDRPSCSGCKHYFPVPNWGTIMCLLHSGKAGKNVFKCSDFDKKG